MYVVITRYEHPKRKRIITHAYAEPAGSMTKADAWKLKRRILKEHRTYNPKDAGTLTVNVLKIVDITLLNSDFHIVTTDSWVASNERPKELQGPHQGPSGEELI
jgi:hypothetical protein